jgi:DNA-binding GntR family transcriptional regulator
MRWLCGLVIHVAGPKLTAENFAALEANTIAGAQLASADERENRALVLTEFYTILAQASDNPVLCVLVETLTSILRQVNPAHNRGGRGRGLRCGRELRSTIPARPSAR